MNHKRTNLIAVITAGANNFAEKEFLNGIISQNQSYGFQTAVFSNIYNHQSAPELFYERRIYELILSEEITGIILLSESFVEASLREKIASLLKQKKIPVIVAGALLPEYSDSGYINVNTSDFDDLEKLTSHLIEVHGFTDIDMLTGMPETDISLHRAEGYQAALRKHHLLIEEKKIHYGDFWFDSGKALAEKYIKKELPLPQAIICANDVMAYGLLEEFGKHQISVPEQVTVVSYEYSNTRLYYSPLLTSYRRNRRELGKIAAETLYSILNGNVSPVYTPPEGSFICGDSCPCPRNAEQNLLELREEYIQKTDMDYSLFSSMEHKLTLCRNMEEFMKIIRDFHWTVKNKTGMFLCLYTDWYDLNASESETLLCRNILCWGNPESFEINQYHLSEFFERNAKADVCYFVPVFSSQKLFGYMILLYETPESYDNIFRHWIKSITTGLEFLRLKNDIRYLLSCQNLSEYRDNLTQLYNEKGLKRAFEAVSVHDDKKLYFIMLKVCLYHNQITSIENGQKTEAILGAAKAVSKFCGNHDIAGHISEDVFLCLIQSNAETELLSDAFTSLLIQEKNYMHYAGIDSFLCAAVPCEKKSFSELLTLCKEQCRQKYHLLSERRRTNYYTQLLPIRNHIYLSPELTFTQDKMRIPDEMKNIFRLYYKSCFGVSFHQDCISARIAKAKYYLLTTSMNLSTIAEKCGYVDNKYFLRQFSVNTGIPALQYRNLMKG